MADFLNSVKNNVTGGSTDPLNKLLSTGIDKDRNNFLKGLKTTSSGQKEDPTYLGFRLLFDFNYGSSIDTETYLPISPILCASDQIQLTGANGMDLFSGSKAIRNRVAGNNKPVANVTNDIYYFTAGGYLSERRTLYEDSHNKNRSYRAESLKAFQTMIKSINEKSPWFIKSIDGLKELLTIVQTRSYPGSGQEQIKSHRSGKLVLNCMDSIDLRITAMADFYRKATYDPIHMRSIVPQNLRKFRMWIIVTELRNMHLSSDLLDVLNPFNNSAVSNIASIIADISQSSGINNTSANPADPSTNPNKGTLDAYDNLSKLEPYIFMYQLDQCEFDFDEYAHIPSNLSNEGSTTPVTNKFAIHVGKITEKSLQYNILSDLIQNKSQFSKILLADSWNMDGSMIGTESDVNNDGDLFGRLANNFINNSVSSVIQQYSPIVSKAVLGNVYGFQMSDIANLANSAQDALNGLSNLKSPFMDSRPQARGFGGPNQRVYPSINEDVYTKTNLAGQGPGIGSVYSTSGGASVAPHIDVYPGDPGQDLGLPGRLYPSIKQDEYPGDPGSDLGPPGRVYKSPRLDVYPGDPGPDLGLPGRVYPSISQDVYSSVPGPDLGAPSRVYPIPSEDVYPGDPTPDLGLPGRVYPNIVSDVYSSVPGTDLGAPSRVYPRPSEDVYLGDPTPDLGLPGRVYPNIVSDGYSGVPGPDLGPAGRVYARPSEDVYLGDPAPDLGLPGRVYPSNSGNVYPIGTSANDSPIIDVYPDSPGKDLGLPGRVYPRVANN